MNPRAAPAGLLGVAIAFAAAYPAGAGEAPNWDYSGAEGPENWNKLASEYGACNGKHQSPINLTHFVEADLRPIEISYSAAGTELLNNGHTEQVNYAPGSNMSVDGVRFELKQLHFHAPSENQIDGESYAMEAHLVHADKDGNLAVVAIMFEQGDANKALASIWPRLPEVAGTTSPLPVPFSAAELLPADLDYYRFDGSLTTPPCTEGVRWLVLKHSVTASREQLERFLHIMHHPNNRPVQPVNDRAVLQ